MIDDYLGSIPFAARHEVAELAALLIEQAHSTGAGRWGMTPYTSGIRINVGWTEILTALPDHLRLIVDGRHARSAAIPRSVSVESGSDPRGYYPSIPGSLLLVIPYAPTSRLRETVTAIRPALLEAVRIAARRRSGRGVKQGHRQQAVVALSAQVGRPLPSPGYESSPTRALRSN